MTPPSLPWRPCGRFHPNNWLGARCRGSASSPPPALRSSISSKITIPAFGKFFPATAKRRALRTRLVEDSVYGKLEPSVGPFVRLFGGVAGQSQSAFEGSSTVDQALFITNGEPIRSWLNPRPGSLVERCLALTDSSNVAELLYLSLLSRRPTSEERAEVADYLARRTRQQPQERTNALRELVWSLIASTEFRFNH